MNELKSTMKKQKFINRKSWTICIVTTIILIVVLGCFISTKFIEAKEAIDDINLSYKYLQEGKYEEAILTYAFEHVYNDQQLIRYYVLICMEKNI